MNKSTCFKIRRISDGLFSTGGFVPKFTKNGKVWNSLGALKNHLRLSTNCGRYKAIYNPASNFQIIELEVSETEMGLSSFQDLHYGCKK